MDHPHSSFYNGEDCEPIYGYTLLIKQTIPFNGVFDTNIFPDLVGILPNDYFAQYKLKNTKIKPGMKQLGETAYKRLEAMERQRQRALEQKQLLKNFGVFTTPELEAFGVVDSDAAMKKNNFEVEKKILISRISRAKSGITSQKESLEGTEEILAQHRLTYVNSFKEKAKIVATSLLLTCLFILPGLFSLPWAYRRWKDIDAKNAIYCAQNQTLQDIIQAKQADIQSYQNTITDCQKTMNIDGFKVYFNNRNTAKASLTTEQKQRISKNKIKSDTKKVFIAYTEPDGTGEETTDLNKAQSVVAYGNKNQILRLQFFKTHTQFSDKDVEFYISPSNG